MKMKKTLGSLAAVAAVGALIAGATFAAWSSNVTSQNSAESGSFTLTVDGAENSTIGFQGVTLAPGTQRVQDFDVAAISTDPALAGALTVYLKDIGGHPDLLNEARLAVQVGQNVNGACTNFTPSFPEGHTLLSLRNNPRVNYAGVLSESALRMTGINYTLPVPAGHTIINQSGVTSPSQGPALVNGQLIGQSSPEVQIPARPEACVRTQLWLPFAQATNASQGKELSYNLQFDLNQIPTANHNVVAP